MSDWKTTTLGDFISLQRGHDLPYHARKPGKIPVVGSGGATGFHDTAVVAGPGITIGRAANLGVPTLVQTDFWPLNTTLYVTDFHGNDVMFTYYLLRTLDLAGFNSGSVQPMLNRNYIRDFQIRVPDTSEQKEVSRVLEACDDKIAANGQIAQTCDDLRSLRLAHWMTSNPELVDERPLSSLAKFINGRAFTKDANGIGRMVIRIAEINSGPGGSTVYNDIDVPDANLARPGDVLFAWSGSLAVARWFRPEGIVNQHIFKVVPAARIPVWLIYELINSKLALFKGIAADKATTMGHIQRRHLDQLVSIPVQERIPELDAALGPLWNRALLAEEESLKLVQLRDTLLPRLMSGEIRVRDAEKIVEDVT
jgi:type I restriction enzyme, S subunit